MIRACLLATVLLPAPALAQDSGLLSARLIAGGTGDAGVMAALVLDLAPGWKTYWRSPGDSGIAARFDWAGSQNLGNIAYMWPVPQMFDLGGERVIGYQDQLVLPLAITPQAAGQPVRMQGHITFGLCKDICMPMQVTLAADIAPDAPPSPLIAAALARQPMTPQQAGAQDWRCTLAPIRDGVQVALTLTMPAWPGAGAGAESVVFAHVNPQIWTSPAQVVRAGDQLQALVDLVPPQARPFDLLGDDLRITVLAAGQAAEWTGCPVRPGS
jgi:DsbC/DsbD-like thiol-disulfide interchange protein